MATSAEPRTKNIYENGERTEKNFRLLLQPY